MNYKLTCAEKLVRHKTELLNQMLESFIIHGLFCMLMIFGGRCKTSALPTVEIHTGKLTLLKFYDILYSDL